ncbi:alpha/beta hydrolase [Geomicrobium sp. JSM 1781026]|uniref:alpha/beta hydrolase n=1 Tax=Geomicrobium sp. JSM 1781026 TaxID=3344580 RepID=UPI0035BF52A3
MKKKGWLAGGVAAAAGLIGAGTYFYSVAIKRAPKDFLEGSADLQDDFFEHQDVTDDWLRAYDAVEVNEQSTDGFRLHGFYINGDITLGKTVIIAHGYAGQAQDMKDWAQMYVKKGYNVLLPDARGHGKSEGNYIGFGYHEREDYVSWVNWIGRRRPNDSIILHGVSMGAATVLMTSGERTLSEQVKAVISDCSFSSLSPLLAYQLQRMYKLPRYPLVPLTSVITKMRAGYSFKDASPVDFVQRSTLPTLFIHGGDDSFVPTSMVYELYKRAAGEKALYVVTGAEHGNSYHTDPQEYEDRVFSWISQHS